MPLYHPHHRELRLCGGAMTTRFHDGRRYEPVRTESYTRTDGGETEPSLWQSECPACVSGAVIIAQLIGDDRAQAGDIVARGRSPVFALCRALLAAGANPNSKLECFRGSVLALTVKTIGIGAKLTIKENDWVGPKVVPYEPFSRDRVGRHVRQNDDPAPSPLSEDSLADGG
jgi:hypothetical protein